jgi:hypothetical protein
VDRRFEYFNDGIGIFFGVGGPNFTWSFYWGIFDKVYTLGGLLSAPVHCGRTGGAVVVDFQARSTSF